MTKQWIVSAVKTHLCELYRTEILSIDEISPSKSSNHRDITELYPKMFFELFPSLSFKENHGWEKINFEEDFFIWNVK